MKREVGHIMEAVGARFHVFNLGHGIVPHTPQKHVSDLINMVRSYG